MNKKLVLLLICAAFSLVLCLSNSDVKATDSDDRWTIPIGGGFGRVFKIGQQPVNASVKAYHNLESPTNGSDWQLQFQIQFLFPK
jgi:hypothetical protein